MTNLYIIDNKISRSSVYGIGTYINELAKSLQQSDLRPCFIHLNSDTQRFSQEIENGIIHWYLPLPKVKYKDAGKHEKLFFRNVVFILRQYIPTTANPIFHLNSSNLQPFSDALKASFHCKIIVTVHYFSWCFNIFGNISRMYKIIASLESSSDPLSEQVKKSFNDEKALLCSVDRVLCLSKHTAEILQKLYHVKKQNISVIYNGLEDKNTQMVNRKMIRGKYQLPTEVPIIIFAGRLDPGKGLSYFIRASRVVFDHYPDCHIIIAGNGDFDTYLKECGNKWMNIHFTGLLEKSELYELYSIADFGVMPSLHEQCSYVAIEMMMHGLPIIASTATGLSEMIEEDVTGLHVPMVEFEDKVEIDVLLLAEKMLYLLENESERKQMGKNARKRYKNLYSLGKMANKMLKFYQTL